MLFASEAQALITVTRTSAPVFYTNSNAGTATTSPQCTYLSFDIKTDTAINDAWATIGTFTGGFLTMGGGDDGTAHFGPMAAGETKAAFYYVCSSYAAGGVSALQSYNITTFSGNPLSGGVLGVTNFTTTIDDAVIQASANTVNAIWADINPSVLGATTTLTVDGDTGTIGCVNPDSTCGGSGKTATSGPLAFNPATFTDWRADSYELVGTSIVLSVGNSGTYNNVLYIDQVPNSATTHYVATYYFRPVATTASTTTLSPVSYLASGTQIKHTNLGSGAYATSGGLLPILPAENKMVLAKSVSHATLPAQGGTVTYTVTATNSGAYPVDMDSFNDVLPAGATYVAGSTTFNDVAFADPTIAGSDVSWSSFFNVPAGASRTLIYQVTLPPVPGSHTNSATARVGNAVIDTTLSTSDNVPATATTIVLNAPTLSKAFSPTALAIGNNSVLTLTISNPNGAHALNGIAVSDTLPAGLVFASPTGAATTCTGATLSVAADTIAITGGSLAAGQSCTLSVNVTSATNGVYTNTTGVVSSTNGGTGLTASASIEFSPKPTISKAFSVSSIPLNGTSTLTFSITNNTAAAITGMTFDDLFPVGLVTVNPPNATASPCGGTLSSWDGATAAALKATGGDVGLRLTGGGIATAGGSCSFSIDVTSAAAGTYLNTTSGVNAVESAPAGPVSNTASLTVMAGPTVTKAFSPATIGLGQSSKLVVTLSNGNASDITGAAFTDTYPAGITTAAIANAATTCAAATVSAIAGSLSVSGATIPAAGSCTVSVDVTSVTAGIHTNTIAAAAVTTTNAGSNAAPAAATLTVNTTPTITKSFTFNPLTSTGTMNLTVANNDTAAVTALSFSDIFPVGMTTANPLTTTNSCLGTLTTDLGAALSATGGDSGIKLAGGSIAAAPATCTITINLEVNSVGVYQNQTTASTSSLGTGSPSNVATWIAPSVGKTFTPVQVTPTAVGPSDISRMIITLTNPSFTTALTGLTISDVFPTTATKVVGGILNAGLQVVLPPTVGSVLPLTTCAAGILTDAAGVALAAGSTSVKLTGATLAPGASCSIEVDVQGIDSTPAIYANVTDKVASNQGIGLTGSDTLTITTRPTIKKSFVTSSATLVAGSATSVVSIIIENNSAADLTGLTISDTFPISPGPMTLADPALVTNSCGGALTDTAGLALAIGSTSIKLTGGAITALVPTCTITFPVQVAVAGSYSNTTSGASSDQDTTVGPASNTAIMVANLAAPTVTKTFTNTAFQVGGSNTLSITLSNSNTVAITGAAFTDTYPVNMLNAPSPALTNTCGGTATAPANGGSLSLSGGVIPAGGSCTMTVAVTATAVGSYTNTVDTYGVISNNANAGPAAAVTAVTTAYLAPTVAKTFGAASFNSGGVTTLTLTLTNPATNLAAITGIQLDDTFPAGLTLSDTTFTFTPFDCGTVTSTVPAASAAGDNNIRFSVASLAVAASCKVSVNVTSSTVGAITNTTEKPVATGPAALTGVAAWADLTVSNAPVITLTHTVAATPSPIPGAILQYTTIVSNAGGPTAADSTFITDAIPAYTALFVNDIAGAGSGPILFTQGAPSSALNYTFTALADAGDDLSFSNDGGLTWVAVPAPGADGCDPSITHFRINLKNAFIGDPALPTSFQVDFKVCIK